VWVDGSMILIVTGIDTRQYYSIAVSESVMIQIHWYTFVISNNL
jgi:hypothetical protein